MKKIELLAPAGSYEKAKIAFLYGADAVYCGTSSLSLRTRADMQNEESWIIVNSPEQKTAVKIEYSADRETISSAGINPGLPESDDNWHLFQMAVITNIQNSRWNGKEAYNISFNFIEQEEYRMWVNKEDYRIIGQINGTSIDVEGNTYTNISSYAYTFNTLTEEDVKMPDLTGYTIKDVNGNIVEE